jgi:hypothetical protein
MRASLGVICHVRQQYVPKVALDKPTGADPRVDRVHPPGALSAGRAVRLLEDGDAAAVSEVWRRNSYDHRGVPA